MPVIEERAPCAAPAEAVWRLLHDPARFAEWWEGTERVEVTHDRPVRYLTGWPDLPMPMTISSRADGSRVVVSCLVSDVLTEWSLEPSGHGCAIAARVEIPEREAARAPGLRQEVRASLARLVERAERG